MLGLLFYYLTFTRWYAALVFDMDPWLPMESLLQPLLSWTYPAWLVSTWTTRVMFWSSWYIVSRMMEGDAWLTYFRWHLLCLQVFHFLSLRLIQRQLIPHHSSRHDIRFWVPWSLTVHLTTSWPTNRHTPVRSSILHNQFGIHVRIRRRSATIHVDQPRYLRCQGWYDAFDEEWHDTSQGDPDLFDEWYDTTDELWYDARSTVFEDKFVTSQSRGERLTTLLQSTTAARHSFSSDHVHAYIATLGTLKSIGLQVKSSTDRKIAGAYLAGPEQRHVPIVIDTGCSFSISPFLNDFVTTIEPAKEIEMNGLKDSVAIQGIGWVEWPIRDVFGNVAVIRTRAYYIPEASIRLFSSQVYFQENNAGHIDQDHEKIVITTARGEQLSFPYQQHNNLPLMFLDFCVNQAGLTGQQTLNLTTSLELERTYTLLDENNYNLTKHAKELLLWHYRLGHAGFGWIQYRI